MHIVINICMALALNLVEKKITVVSDSGEIMFKLLLL